MGVQPLLGDASRSTQTHSSRRSTASAPVPRRRLQSGALSRRASAPAGRPRQTWEQLGRRPRGVAHAQRRLDCGRLPAAGAPWFMTVFGRDTLITCLQTLVFGPELAQAPCACSPRRRPRRTTRSATPSRGRSSTRSGAARLRWLDRPLLRLGRRDAPVPHPALGAVALDGRRRDRDRARGCGTPRARLDRRARRSGR